MVKGLDLQNSSDPPDLKVSIHLDGLSSAQRFWKAKPKCLNLVRGSKIAQSDTHHHADEHNETDDRELLVCVGTESGSIWLIPAGLQSSPEYPKADAAVNGKDASSSGAGSSIHRSARQSTSSKISSASPGHSRPQSPLATSAALLPPTISFEGAGEPSFSISRSRATSGSASSIDSRLKSHAAQISFLPSSGVTAKAQLAPASAAALPASESSVATKRTGDLRELLEDNRDESRERDGSMLQDVAGRIRSGSLEIQGKEDQRPHLALGALGLDAIGMLGKGLGRRDLAALDEPSNMAREAETESREASLKKLEAQADKARQSARDGARERLPAAEAPQIAMIEIASQSGRKDEIVALCNDPEDCFVIALTVGGTCKIVDALSKSVTDAIDLQTDTSPVEKAQADDDGKRPRLSPPLSWKGVSIFSFEEHRYVVAWAFPPRDVPEQPETRQTTLVIMVLNEKARSFKVCSRITLPGLAQVGIMRNDQGPPTLVSSDGRECRVTHLLIGLSGQQTPLHVSRSANNLVNFFTPTPSRPSSRGANQSEEEDRQGLGRLLGKRFFTHGRQSQNKGSLEEVKAGPGTVAKIWAEQRLAGISVSSRGLVVTWRGSLVEVYRSAGSTLHPYPQTISTEAEVTRVLTSAHDNFIFVYTQLLHTFVRNTEGDFFAMLHRDACHLREQKSLDLGRIQIIADSKPRWHWTSVARRAQGEVRAVLDHALAVGNDSVLIGDSSGNLCRSRFLDLLSNLEGPRGEYAEDDPDRLAAEIRCLKHFRTPKWRDIIISGDADGSLRIWKYPALCRIKQIAVFASAVVDILMVENPQNSELKGKVVARSEEGQLAVIDMEKLDLHGLQKVLLSEDDLILSYANGRVRVWNLASKEFRRSTSHEAAEEMLSEKKWLQLEIRDNRDKPSVLHLSMDQIRLQDNKDVAAVRFILSCLHAWNLSEQVDSQCQKTLVMQPPLFPIRCTVARNAHSEESIDGPSRIAVWKISPQMTSVLSLLVVALFRQLMDFDPQAEVAVTHAITFYAALMADAIGPEFQEPDIEYLAMYYFDSNPNIQQAARLLFDSRLSRLQEDVIVRMADEYIGALPANQPKALKSRSNALFALTILGAIALRRMPVLSAVCLKDVSSSILQSLQFGGSVARVRALDLCARGFQTWQTYVDPSELLRSIFQLAVAKEDVQRDLSGEVIAQARSAMLKLSTTASALFINTLSMDVVDAETIQQRDSVMKLCVLIARSKPQALFPNLPRLAEAVVKSLDPTRVTMRESIQQTATVILNELVKIFPAIDFSGKTQKLAVGTSEGAIIMYDIKTATRLYVLECHKHQVSALSFSPDGRRLVTVSLQEHNLTIWKVGSSFSSVFNVGGPPRQGAPSGEPFKRLDFAAGLGGEDIDPATGSSRVTITWPGERSACLVIGEMKLTFAT